MKKFILVLLTLFVTNSFAGDCKTIDLDHLTKVVIGEERPNQEESTFFGPFIDIFELYGCILDAETMADLNMTKASLVKFSEYMELSYQVIKNEFQVQITILEESIKTESDLKVKMELEERLEVAKDGLRFNTSDNAFFQSKIKSLLAS